MFLMGLYLVLLHSDSNGHVTQALSIVTLFPTREIYLDLSSCVLSSDNQHSSLGLNFRYDFQNFFSIGIAEIGQCKSKFE